MPLASQKVNAEDYQVVGVARLWWSAVSGLGVQFPGCHNHYQITVPGNVSAISVRPDTVERTFRNFFALVDFAYFLLEHLVALLTYCQNFGTFQAPS